MNMVKAEIVERQTSALPKGFRFLTFEGRRVFESNGGVDSHHEVCILRAPEEISDYDLKGTDVIASRVIKFPMDCTPKQFMDLLRDGINAFVEECTQGNRCQFRS